MSQQSSQFGSSFGTSSSSQIPQQTSQACRNPTELQPSNLPEDALERYLLFEERVARIPEMTMDELRQLVYDASINEDATSFQRMIVERGLRKILGLLHPGSIREPKQVQIDTVYAMVFGQSDVLLIARTGEGKSLVFQAFSMLIGRVTLQIVPLSRLGAEQSDDVQRMHETSGIRSIAITAETKEKNPRILEEIAEGKYQHVVLGPEQTSHPEFRSLLRRPGVRDRIGAVVIDEVHLVMKWKDFRPEFVEIRELRILLRRDTVWLGASATVSQETEDFVLKHGGFRAVDKDNRPFYTKVIRSSIDRPDITYVLKKIPRENLGNFDQLFFLLQGGGSRMATLQDMKDHPGDGLSEATPHAIKKTMIFVDGRKHVQNMAETLRSWLIAMTRDCPGPRARRYAIRGHDGGVDVCQTVQTYTSTIAKHDQELRYAEFSQTTSKIRIMVTTTALSTGLNVPDVARVLQWKFPITMDIEDVCQRLGRVGRTPGIGGTAFLFLPYQIDDNTKRTRDAMDANTSQQPASSGRAKRRGPRTHQPPRPSTLRYEIPGESVGGASECEAQSDAAGSQAGDQDDRPADVWTKAELKTRDKIPPVFMRVWNDRYRDGHGRCPRQILNEHLGEARTQYPQDAAPKESCCNHCNPSLYPDALLPPAPPRHEPITRPPKGSRAFIALTHLQSWCSSQAEMMFPGSNRSFEMPSDFFMDDQLLWSVCRSLFGHAKTIDGWQEAVVESMSTRVGLGLIEAWESKHLLPELVKELNRIAPLVYNEATQLREAKAAKARLTVEARHCASTPTPATREVIGPHPQPQSLADILERQSQLQEALDQSARQETLRKRAVANQATLRLRQATQQPTPSQAPPHPPSDDAPNPLIVPGRQAASPPQSPGRSRRQRREAPSGQAIMPGDVADALLTNVCLTTRSGRRRSISAAGRSLYGHPEGR